MTTDSTANPAPRPTLATSLEVFQQIGLMTRRLHDTLNQLDVMPQLRQAADGLPDARTRLAYIARKTGEAAHRVLNAVDLAKLEHSRIADDARRMALAIGADPVAAVATGAMLKFAADVQDAAARGDAHLTDIMLAQDFHDLTGQVVGKLTALAGDLEDGLVKLLLQATPPGHAPEEAPRRSKPAALLGPTVGTGCPTGVVADQCEVDDLLATLGF